MSSIMTSDQRRVRSVAIIGAGAAGAITAAAFKAENYFHKIRVFERRGTPGGTWIYDPTPNFNLPLRPGILPPSLDPPLPVPNDLPKTTSPAKQFRFEQTPIYEQLTTNVPAIAMSFSDTPFAYGPFVPHHIPRQYIESHFSAHNTDHLLSLNTTVEDLSRRPSVDSDGVALDQWRLTLRKHDLLREADEWWEEAFDAVILANGHYSVPFIPKVSGLEEYIAKFPGRITHSKTYRSPHIYRSKKVLVIGNSASGHDVTAQIVTTAHLPVYQSRRSRSRWDGDSPPDGISWKPIIKCFEPSGRIVFDDETYLDDIDVVIYCTGYLPSYPFWNINANGRPLWDYTKNKIINGYQHTFFNDYPTLAIVGLPRVLTFRSFEYQAIALARLWSARNSKGLPPVQEQRQWDLEREAQRRKEKKKFHDIEWETGETLRWLGDLYDIAGLPNLTGEGRVPPVLDEKLRWAVEHVRKYPEPGKKQVNHGKAPHPGDVFKNDEMETWVLVQREENIKDILAFI